MTKKDKVKRCQKIRDSLKDGEFVGDKDFDFINDIFLDHRWYSQKTQGQPCWFYVDTEKKYKTRCFYIEREDGSTTDFSFYECIYPTKGYRSDFIKAARSAISEDIIIEKKRFLTTNTTCNICKKPISLEKSHLDHYPFKFKTILNNFIKINNIKDFKKLTELENWDNISGVQIVDRRIKDDWIHYHENHSTFRILCPECNLKLN